LTGTFINVGTVLLGSVAGTLLKHRIPSKLSGTVIQGIGLFTLFIGMKMAFEGANPVIMVFSILIGGIVGEALDIEGRLEAVGRWFEARFAASDGNFTKGFVTASLLFCVGPMTIVGSIEDGLRGNYQILLTKAIMDGFCATAFSSTLGLGVGLAALTVLFYQGALTLAASYVKAFLTDPIVATMTATGGLLIIGIGVNLLELGKVKVGNLLPALVVAVVLAAIFG